jgi:hypothetical protein
MKIELDRIGVFENYLPPHAEFKYDGKPTILSFLKDVAEQLGKELLNELMHRNTLKPNYVILLNGRSIYSIPEGLNSSLEDGDIVVIALLVDGG